MNIEPHERSLVESVAQSLPDGVRAAFVRDMRTRGALDVDRSWRLLEADIWSRAAGRALRLCHRCSTVWMAPEGVVLRGSPDMHARACVLSPGKVSRPVERRALVCMRMRTDAKARTALERFLGARGTVPPLAHRLPTERADEAWFEAWAGDAGLKALAGWERTRELKVLPPPAPRERAVEWGRRA